MAPHVRMARVPRAGGDPGSCDDAVAIAPGGGTDDLVVAVADGATESLGSGAWAELLVQALVHVAPGDDLAVGIDRARTGWPARLAALADAAQEAGRPWSWVQEDALARGTWATCTSVRWTAGRAEAIAVGDSCLFHGRGDDVLAAFPVTRQEDFGSTPDLVAADPGTDRGPVEPQRWSATVRPSDRLVLATDALAEWVLREAEAGRCPLPILDRELVRGAEAFAAWVDGLRHDHRLRDDDIAVVSIQVS